MEKYLNASPEEKVEMELRYGLRHIQTLTNNTLAENWIENNCKNCPLCNVSIEVSKTTILQMNSILYKSQN